MTTPGRAPSTATPLPEDERHARLALSLVAEPGDLRVARLVAALGAVEVVRALEAQLDLPLAEGDPAQGRELSGALTARFAQLQPDKVLASALDRGIAFLVPGDPGWPDQLHDLRVVEPLNRMGGEPLGLWVRGDLAAALPARRGVAVVGSRSATTYGAEVARDLGADLAGAGWTVVSGAAFGIDHAAHRGAVAVGAPTVAVLACGVDRAYPAAHARLLAHIAETGALVSELPPGAAPTRSRFLARNRVIAALGVGTVVVEAAIRSGALNTASWAARLQRPVLGVPGPVTSAPSAGVHELVRSGAATLVTRAAHVEEVLADYGHSLLETPRVPETPRDRLSAVDHAVLEAVPLHRPATVQSVARTAGVTVDLATSALGRLREAGWIEVVAGRWRQAPATLFGEADRPLP